MDWTGMTDGGLKEPGGKITSNKSGDWPGPDNASGDGPQAPKAPSSKPMKTGTVEPGMGGGKGY